MTEFIAKFIELWADAKEIWLSGGWAMIAIALTALVMFALGTHVHLKLSGKGFSSVREKKWRRWLDQPKQRRGTIGYLLDFVDQARSLKHNTTLFEELRQIEVSPFDRDLKVMNVCVSAAPLLGLLGTVTGMLATFTALATGAGGDKTMGLVAEGISEALVTTETGLVIALAGLFFRYHLSRKLDAYKAFLAHLESVCAQRALRRQEVAANQSSGSRVIEEVPGTGKEGLEEDGAYEEIAVAV